MNNDLVNNVFVDDVVLFDVDVDREENEKCCVVMESCKSFEFALNDVPKSDELGINFGEDFIG